jgi:hypothetical protein
MANIKVVCLKNGYIANFTTMKYNVDRLFICVIIGVSGQTAFQIIGISVTDDLQAFYHTLCGKSAGEVMPPRDWIIQKSINFLANFLFALQVANVDSFFSNLA